LAWARNYLKWYGLLENSARGVWALTEKGGKVGEVDKAEVKKAVAELQKAQPGVATETEETTEKPRWQDKLIEVLKKVPPSSFERICQRLLRESGFVQVEVTGRSGDEGIDGKGVVRIGGLLSFHVIFQCKRYSKTVSAGAVRDFRGAMVGRADKGLLITTGTFSRDARREAQRDGAPPIDLIDGEALAEKLKELGIGVTVSKKVVEEVVIHTDWLEGF